MACGFLEVQGFSAALAAMDAMCKAAHVRLLAVDANNTCDDSKAVVSVVVQVKIRGSIGDVRAALEAGRTMAEKTLPAEFVLTHFIASDNDELDALLSEGKLVGRKTARKNGKQYAALGCADIRCFAHAVNALDTLLKAVDVEVLDVKKYLGGQTVTAVVGGEVSAVKAGLDIAGQSFSGCPNYKNSTLILNPHPEIMRFIG